jgi:hypothetical protein
MQTYEVLVYEGWGKSYLIEADSPEEAEQAYETLGGEHFGVAKESLNETFIVETTEND